MGIALVGKVMQETGRVSTFANNQFQVDVPGKRWFDLIVSGLLLIVLAPAFLVIAILIKLDSRGPVFFRQTRTGMSKKPFMIWKFRSMTVQENGCDVVQAKRNDQRITRIGKFLRSTSIDELPQLINVMLGDMSLVGPRPHACSHDREFATVFADYDHRFSVRPGITGLAQVIGLRGETDTNAKIRARSRADILYIQRRSFLLDVLILFRTAIVLVWGQENAY